MPDGTKRTSCSSLPARNADSSWFIVGHQDVLLWFKAPRCFSHIICDKKKSVCMCWKINNTAKVCFPAHPKQIGFASLKRHGKMVSLHVRRTYMAINHILILIITLSYLTSHQTGSADEELVVVEPARFSSL